MLIQEMKKFSPALTRKGAFSSLSIKDLGELAVVRGHPHAGIVRLVNWSAFQQASICLTLLARYGTELQTGAMVTVDPSRVRVRPANAAPESP